MGKNSFFLKLGAFAGSCSKYEKVQGGVQGKVDRSVALAAMMQVFLIAAIVAAAANGLALEIVDRVVAIVNNDVVSLYELNQSVQPFVEKIQSSQYPDDVERQLMFEARQKVLQQLIDQKTDRPGIGQASDYGQ